MDRSSTGTGVAGRIALLHAKGEVELNDKLMIESIVDGGMIVSANSISTYFGKNTVLPEVSGR